MDRTGSRKFCNPCRRNVVHLETLPGDVPPINQKKNVRIGILDKHTQLVYHYKPKKRLIEVLLFWGMKQDPSKFKY